MISSFFSSQLRRNMFSGAAMTVINAGVTLVSYPVYLHYLGYEKLGVWMILSTVLMFMQMCSLGMGPAIMKLVAEEHGKENTEAIQNYVTTAIWTLVATGGIALAVLLLFSEPIIGLFKLESENAAIARRFLPFMGVLTIYALVVQILTATLSGLGRMDQVNYRDSGCRTVSLGVSATLLLLGYGIESLIVGMTVSYLLLHLTSVVLIKRLVNVRLSCLTWNVKRFHVLIAFGGAMLFSSVINMILLPFTKLAISRYVGVASVPVFEIPYNMAMQIRVLFDSIVRTIAPEISKTLTEINRQTVLRVHSLNAKLVRIILVYGGPFYGLALVCCVPAIKVWLGSKYTPAIPQVFIVFMAANFFCLFALPAYYTLLGMGKVRDILVAIVFQTGVGCVLVCVAAFTGIGVNVIGISLAPAIAVVGGAVWLIAVNRWNLLGMRRACCGDVPWVTESGMVGLLVNENEPIGVS